MSRVLNEFLTHHAENVSAGVAPTPPFHPAPKQAKPFSHRAAEVLLLAPGLQRRAGQLRMLALIAQILAEEREESHAAVEAGTGTGKSYAYLVPVVLQCVETGLRAVVATGTKNLQEQLHRKDVPFVAELVEQAAEKKVHCAVMFGRANYLCPFLLANRLKRLWKKAEAGNIGEKSLEELCWLDMLQGWLDHGGSGLRDHLPVWSYVPGTEGERESWWSRVSAADEDADCRGCRESCAFRRAREAASTACVVVANHHLVAADFLLRRDAGVSIFGNSPPEILILDEAHDFSDAFRSVLEARFTLQRCARLRDDILQFLHDLMDWANKEDFSSEAAYVQEKINAAKAFARKHYPDWKLKALLDWFQERRGSNRERLSISPDLPPESARELLEGLASFFLNLMDWPDRAVAALEEAVAAKRPDGNWRFERLLRRHDRLKGRINNLLAAFRRAVLAERHYRVVGASGDTCTFDGCAWTAAPVKVADHLAELWQRYRHIVLTSATLFPFPQSEGFRWFREEYGFAENELAQGVVPSPFCWEKQMRAFVLTHPDLAPPDGGGQAERRVQKLAEAILGTAERTRGGVLALFTSYQEMHAVADLVRHRLPASRPLLVQGQDGGKTELLTQFKEHGRAVLFGVASFWQGVDVPGDALTALFVAKLPFPQPDDPLVEALCWLAGREWWLKVYRPLTALTLRQGVGRLIRTERDRGVVILADPRAAGKHKWFLQNCLPVEPVEVET